MLLKSKVEATDAFQILKKQVELQASLSIKIVQVDRGGE